MTALAPRFPIRSPEGDVLHFCSTHGLLPSVSDAVRLVRLTFTPLRDLRFDMDIDPDTDDRRVVLDVTVDATVDEVLRQYREFTRQWVQSAPADVREWIRVSYHTVSDR